jgi:F-type H+-transporting ATPase subunit b
MQIIDTVALISINETLVVLLISFLIFLFVINRLMFRPLRNTMSEREHYIENITTDIADAQKAYQNISDEIKKRESAAKAAGLEMIKKSEEAGADEAAKIFASSRKEILSLKKDTEAQVADKLSEARKSLDTESQALAITIMEKALDRRLTV